MMANPHSFSILESFFLLLLVLGLVTFVGFLGVHNDNLQKERIIELETNQMELLKIMSNQQELSINTAKLAIQQKKSMDNLLEMLTIGSP